MADATATNVDTILGRMVVEQGLATSDEVKAAMAHQRQMMDGTDDTAGTAGKEDPRQMSLADILVTEGVVTEKQIKRIRPKIEEQSANQQIPGFRMLKKLGAGAMAKVYLANQVSLDRLVAIKVLPRKFMKNDEFVERFYAEGRAAAKLNHPNIVGAYDVGHAGEYHYFVMEYVEGKTVYDDLADGKIYPEAEALDLVIQIALALEHSHKAGFIHRDVKPKNIMITTQGVAKLADMGLARAVSDVEAAEAEQGKAYGTPYYISPEQIRGLLDVDFRCDIYGLGATFYHMVTGRVPFDAPNPSAVMHRHLKDDLTPPDHINPKLSAGIGEIIEVCMAKDPSERYATTSDLLHDLQSVKNGEPPLQARKRFDIADLANLEKAVSPGDTVITNAIHDNDDERSITEQPIFWAAIAGWGVAVILLVLYLIK